MKLKDDEINKQERLAQLRPDEQLSDDEIALPQGITTEAANETIGLRLTIRGKDGKDSKMKVKPVCTAVTSSFTTTPSLFQDAKYPITS